MDITDLLKSSGGTDSLGQLAKTLGIDMTDVTKMVAAVAPLIIRDMAKNARSETGLEALRRALQNGNHDRYLENPSLIGKKETRLDGNKILGHIFGSKQVSREVAASAENDTGIDATLIKKALPFIAAIAMGAMNKRTDAGRSGGLGDLLGMAAKFL